MECHRGHFPIYALIVLGRLDIDHKARYLFCLPAYRRSRMGLGAEFFCPTSCKFEARGCCTPNPLFVCYSQLLERDLYRGNLGHIPNCSTRPFTLDALTLGRAMGRAR